MNRTLSSALETDTDLAVAIRVAQKMLAAYSDTKNFGEFGYAQAHGALSESIRILLRALGAEPAAKPLPPAVAELHRLCRDDYASSVDRRVQDHRDDAHLIEDAEEAARASVDRAFPAVAAFLATEAGEGQ
ncbi:hypothetical protein RM704_15645 [Streptomyces sp. DSM 3412]|uniref:HEPN domain-containing protein n=1 Tax=Streptomyces gottesmaniae TaxID=3075518 RepID=A0ABU2YX38_9ACTN|nr:hypothetical protein [Streptomyces sp. DSM 3412]MDT0568886.1 hypothetical protein [Streptomyces sp. DSM 3412]